MPSLTAVARPGLGCASACVNMATAGHAELFLQPAPTHCLASGTMSAPRTISGNARPIRQCTCPGTPAASVRAAADGGPAQVSMEGGGSIAAARGVIVAADGPAAARLLGDSLHSSPSKPDDGVGTACVYFSCAPAGFRSGLPLGSDSHSGAPLSLLRHRPYLVHWWHLRLAAGHGPSPDPVLLLAGRDRVTLRPVQHTLGHQQTFGRLVTTRPV